MSEDSRHSERRSRSRRTRNYLRAFLREWSTVLAALVLTFLFLAAIIGPEIYPHSPFDQSLRLRNAPLGTESLDPALPSHMLGTDSLGRDITARLLQGARVSIGIGVAGVLVSGTIGIALGLTAGYRRGRVEDVIMRIADVQLAFPVLIIALFVLFVIGPSILNIVLVMAFARWPSYARVSRSLALNVSMEQYIEAAKALGASHPRILWEHVLPNTRATLVIIATLDLAKLVLYESTLSFLGFGVQVPNPSWGLMIADGRQYMLETQLLVVLPGLCILALALSANILARWGQDMADPTRRAQWLRAAMKTDTGS